VRQLVHAADPQVTQTIKRANRPCFVLEGCIPLRRGHRPGPEGIITGGHASKTGRTVAIRYGEAVTTHALIAMFWQVIASDRVGGWRELRAGSRPAVTAYRVDSGPRVADIVLSSRLLKGV
jgi:hypothetical protein